MSVETRTVGRLREVRGSIYMERWLQMDAGIQTVIYGPTGDLNRIDALADSLTAASAADPDLSKRGRVWYGGSSPGEYDNGESDPAWYGQAIRVAFYRLQAAQDWHLLEAALRAFVEAAFPGELIGDAGRRFDRPSIQTPEDPARYVLWQIEYD